MRQLAFLFSVFLLAPVQAQDAVETDNATEYLRIAGDQAAEYKFKVGDAELKLQRDPVLQWSNPIDGEIYGNVYVWHHQGRPVVVGSFYKWYHPHDHSTHEFQSLARGTLKATRQGNPIWRTEVPGISMQVVAKAPPAAKTAVARMSQMRLIAKRFGVRMTEKDGTDRQLRLLNTPLHRSKGSDGSIDGALFAFAKGTDPEALLLLETQTDGDAKTWTFGFARLNPAAMQATQSGNSVWQVARMQPGEAYTRQGCYMKIQID